MSVDSTLTASLRPAQAPAETITAEDFGNLVLQHQRRVYRVIFLLVRNGDTADTLTQECFLRAYQKRESFRGECTVETWLLRIALNLARDHGKNRRATFWKRLSSLEESSPDEPVRPQPVGSDPSPERVLLAREELNAVWAATGSLSEQQRHIFLLRFAEEMPLAEIAGVLGLKVGTVKAQLFRATSKIREKLREDPCD